MCGSGLWWAIAPRCPRVSLRLTRGSRNLDPHGVPLQGGFCPQVRLWLTRGYQRFDPYGVACLVVLFRAVADILCPALPSMIARHNCFLTRRIDYFRATAPSLANTRNQKRLIVRTICAMPRHEDTINCEFRHYMARFGAIFPSETGLGWRNPSLGNRNPWDASAETSHGSVGPPDGRPKRTLE